MWVTMLREVRYFKSYSLNNDTISRTGHRVPVKTKVELLDEEKRIYDRRSQDVVKFKMGRREFFFLKSELSGNYLEVPERAH